MGTHKHKHNHKAYFILMSLEVGLIGIKYQGFNTNPFQQSSPTMLLCLTSLFCHTLTTMADMNFSVTMVIFHISGLVACETLLWILLPLFWNWYIINLFLLVVTSFCFFNTIHSMAKHILPTHSSAAQPPNPEPREASQVRKNRRKVKCRKNMSCGFISTEENTSSCSQELQLWEAESISTWEGCYAMSLCISYAPKLYDIDSDSDRIWVQYEYDT